MKHKGNRKVEKQFVREIKQPPTIVGSSHLEGLERRILVVNIFCPFLSLSLSFSQPSEPYDFINVFINSAAWNATPRRTGRKNRPIILATWGGGETVKRYPADCLQRSNVSIAVRIKTHRLPISKNR